MIVSNLDAANVVLRYYHPTLPCSSVSHCKLAKTSRPLFLKCKSITIRSSARSDQRYYLRAQMFLGFFTDARPMALLIQSHRREGLLLG
jgi:hypothetical protein